MTKEAQQTIRVWLDDERDPTNPNIQVGFGARGDEVWVKTAREAISMLESGNVSFISLDHDLGPQAAGSGNDVAKWIEEQAFLFSRGEGTLQPVEWAVHSANPVGRQNITAALQSADNFWRQSK